MTNRANELIKELEEEIRKQVELTNEQVLIQNNEALEIGRKRIKGIKFRSVAKLVEYLVNELKLIERSHKLEIDSLEYKIKAMKQ